MGFFKKIFQFNISRSADDAVDQAGAEAKDIKTNYSNSTDTDLSSSGYGWYSLNDLTELNSNTDSGVRITPKTAFNRITTVFACVDRRATALAKLPFNVYRREGDSRIHAVEHRLNYLLTKRPNQYQSPTMYKKYIMTCQLLWGYSVILKKMDINGQIAELIPLPPPEVSIQKVFNKDKYLYGYKGEWYTEDEVIYIPYISVDGKIGKAPMSVARESAGAVISMTKHLSRFYKNGAIRQGALVTTAPLGETAKRKLKRSWAELYGGFENSGEPAVLDNGLDFKDISLPLKDAEFIESKRLTAQEIASVFNVPPSMIGLASEKYSNLQEINDRYMQDVVQPDCINIEEAHNYSCFLESERNYYTKFNLAAGMRGAPEKRAAYYKEMLQLGAMTINEIRALEELNGIGELGDKHYFSLNFTTLDTLEKHERIIESGE